MSPWSPSPCTSQVRSILRAIGKRHACLQSCSSASSIFADASLRRQSPLPSPLLLKLMPKAAEGGSVVTNQLYVQRAST